MKTNVKRLCTIFMIMLGGQLFFSFHNGTPNKDPKLHFPFKKEGLTERQAAAHLLSRFTFGAQPGEVDQVVFLGLERWFMSQLNADLPDHALQTRLERFESLNMTNKEINKTYPKKGQLVRMAVSDKVIDKAAVNAANKKSYKDQMMAYMEENGYRMRGELYKELISQKILRAAYSENQLQEMLTSFWFNHFNVSLTNNNCSGFVSAYERDVIRPNAMGSFETILLATAKSPAMLTYLDNFKSAAPEPDQRQQKLKAMEEMQRVPKVRRPKKVLGLNENYAREIMELHTLGVDGGYTQKDVTEAARVLTGWTIFPMNQYYKKRSNGKNLNMEKLAKQGFSRDGDFLFAANRHDKGEKVVLGKKFPANGGYEEGVRLIKMLAHHPSTATFIATKLAVRFVSDNPPESLIKKMAKTFMKKDGDIKQVLITMTSSREFWSENSLREKTKSPFELAISAVRGLNADIRAPYQLYSWINKMGEKMYYYQAPTGFPDNGQYWINTGSLLNRMNFGLALASQRIRGINIDIASINKNREPESASAALLTYSKYMLPERNLSETIKRVTPALIDAEYHKKVNSAAEEVLTLKEKNKQMKKQPSKKGKDKNNYPGAQQGDEGMLARVVGLIIGSPEFQRK